MVVDGVAPGRAGGGGGGGDQCGCDPPPPFLLLAWQRVPPTTGYRTVVSGFRPNMWFPAGPLRHTVAASETGRGGGGGNWALVLGSVTTSLDQDAVVSP